MNITYMGTGATEGMPAIFCDCDVCKYAREHGGKDVRSRASMLIDGALLIDLTPDLFSQAITHKCNLSAIKAVLFTHSHKEHCHPWELRNIRPPYTQKREEGILDICGSQEVLDTVDKLFGEYETQRLSPFMRKRVFSPFVPEKTADYTITALTARHSEGAFCYLVEKDGKALLYGNDTGYFPEETWDYIDGVKLDLVTLDCHNLFGLETENHMNLEDNVTVQRRMFQLGCADIHTRFYATHICHNGHMNHQQLDEKMRLYGFHAAYDGLMIEL